MKSAKDDSSRGAAVRAALAGPLLLLLPSSAARAQARAERLPQIGFSLSEVLMPPLLLLMRPPRYAQVIFTRGLGAPESKPDLTQPLPILATFHQLAGGREAMAIH